MTSTQLDFFENTFLDYLNKNFTPWNIDQFSPEQTTEIYNELEASIPMETLLGCNHLITKYLVDFFNGLGSLEIKIEAFKHISVTTDIHKDTVTAYKLLKHYQKHFEHKEDSNLLTINEQITKAIFDKLESDQDSFRHHIRISLPLVEDIGQKSAILFGKSRITVRKHLESGSKEKRFSGLPVEELEALTKKYFQDIDSELPQLMKKPLQTRFLFQRMSNQEFEATHIKILQEELLKLIKIRSRQDKGVMLALTNYILRLHFDMLHTMIAELLINSIIFKNPKAEQFLSFYTQGVISMGGQKYQIPPLEDTTGRIWSVANIISISGQYQGFQQAYEKKNTHIDSMDTVLENIDDQIMQAAQTIKKIKSGAAKHHQELQATADKIKKIRHTFQSQGELLDPSHKLTLNHTVTELETLEREQIGIRNQFEKGLSQATKDYADLKYKKTSTEERYNIEIDNLEALEEKHKDIIGKYQLMITAIVKALTAKKTKI